MDFSPELPVLPAWISESRDHGVMDGNDFVIPPLADWAHISSRKIPKTGAVTVPPDENQRYIDAVYEIVSSRNSSPDGFAAALSAANIQASTNLVWQLLKRFGNDWVAAHAIFVWAKLQTDYVHNCELNSFMADVLGKYKQFSLMFDLIREMVKMDGSVPLTTMSKAMRRLAKARRYDEAIEIFRKIEEFGLRKDVAALNVLIDALVKEGSVEHGGDVYAEFRTSIAPDSSTFNILIHGYCKVRKFEHARKVMQEMKQFGFTPDVVSYTSLLEAYCRMKDFRKVDAVLTEMREENCKPNVITYTIVMHAFGKAKQVNEAINIYKRTKEEKCKLDAPFYSSFIFTLCKMGRFEDAWEVFNHMESESVIRDVRTYNTMIGALCINMQEEAAMKLLQKMHEDGCKPDMSTYIPLLKLSCKLKRMKVLNFLLCHMFKNDISMDFSVQSMLVDALAKSGMVRHSAHFFCDMVRKGMVPRCHSYRKLVKELDTNRMAEMNMAP